MTLIVQVSNVLGKMSLKNIKTSKMSCMSVSKLDFCHE